MENKKTTFFEITKRFFSPYKDIPIKYYETFLFYLSRALRGIFHVIFLKYIIYFLEIGDKQNFTNTFIYYSIYILIHEIVDFLMKRWGWLGFSEKMQIVLDKKYVEEFVKLDNNKIESIGTGKLISIISLGQRTWITLTNDIFKDGLAVLITLIFTIYMISIVNINYGFLFLILYIVLHIFGYYINFYMLKYRKIRRDAGHNHTKQFVKIIMSKFEILQSSKIKKEILILDKYSNKAHNANMKMTTFVHFFFRIPTLLISILRLIALLYLGNLLFIGDISFSIIVGLSGAFILMDKAIDTSLDLFKNITRDFVHITKLWELFDEIPEISGYYSGKSFVYKSGNIEFKNINYGYSKDKLIFKDFSLNISGEKITAFVGPSGGGKTTLVKLISGYIKANSGEIIIDGQNLSETSLKTYYKDIGYLTQEPSVFDGTVLENLTYAIENTSPQAPLITEEGNINTSSPVRRGLRGGINEKHLNKIIKLAKCEFIYDLPNGLDTEIGERGVRLSGGQKQRLAIAKIFLKDPKIIILDEPTSALDSFSEEQISESLNNLFAGRTVIIIAHRLQTVKHADDIIVIESGKIIERGTHKDLIKQKGHYKKMLDLQSGF